MGECRSVRCFSILSTKQWSGTVLDAIGVVSEQFAKPVAPGTLIGEILPQAVEQTGLPRGTHIYAGGGDGQCAALGVNALGKGRVYLNLGTAIVTGSWSETPQISQAWRTMTSPTGAGYILEGGHAIRDVLYGLVCRELCV